VDFYQRLIAVTQSRRQSLLEKMGDGVPDWAAYQRLVGENKALKRVEQDAIEIATKIAKEQGE
jgi:hypothetical protein